MWSSSNQISRDLQIPQVLDSLVSQFIHVVETLFLVLDSLLYADHSLHLLGLFRKNLLPSWEWIAGLSLPENGFFHEGFPFFPLLCRVQVWERNAAAQIGLQRGLCYRRTGPKGSAVGLRCTSSYTERASQAEVERQKQTETEWCI